ncbi:DUF7344 domain-containing protein [Halosimplex amylolyticum]|uniref:DUF7344 domain-containing protein n=1 Tax=Halosimplex amylolyticum TaxID=3396616 RepID=UPI003F55FA9A
MNNDGNSDTRPSSNGGSYESSEEGVSLDEVHHVLGRKRRRGVLSYLTDHPGEPVPVDELVDIVVERERPGPGPATHRVRVETDLHHVHLPKLADTGIIEFDPVAETVRYTTSEKLEAILKVSIALKEAGEGSR